MESVEKRLESLIEKFRTNLNEILEDENYKIKLVISPRLKKEKTDEKLWIFRVGEKEMEYSYFGGINIAVKERGSE